MARPANTDAAATKARILDSARGLFADVGLDGASVRDVASGAGVTLATVHHYFGSKDDLYAACVATVYAELGAMRDELAKELAETRSAEELVERAVVTGYRFAREHHVAVRLLVRASVGAGALPPRGRESLLTFLDVASRGIASLVGRKPHELRLPLQSLVFLVARFAVQGDAELALVAGGTTGKASIARVERHLVDVAQRLLLDSPASTRHARKA
jgi:AcrR family transcriptional regulator